MKAISHNFIFRPGTWLGEGKITFSVSPEEVRFYTKWIVEPIQEDVISCKQLVEMEGINEKMENTFRIFAIKASSFKIEISNETIGKVEGHGYFEKDKIAWEFKSEHFHGFEVYHLKSFDEYLLHAEYISEEFRTIIKGHLWRKQAE